MKRLRLDSIALTIGLTIVLAMGLGFTLQRLVNVGLWHTGFFSARNPVYHDTRFYLFLLPARVVSLAEALDASSTDQHPGMIAAAQRGPIRIEVLDNPLPAVVNSEDRVSLLVRRRIQQLFPIYHQVITAPETRPIPAPKTEAYDPPARERKSARTLNPRRGGKGMLVEVMLRDSHWLLFTTNIPTPRTDPAAAEFSRASLGGTLALAAVLILLLSLLTTRRLANPLSRLAVAVERLGTGGDEPLLPPKGPRELRIVIEAFNRMHERLRRFNEDRLQMLAAMSHDLRTSLTRVKLRLEVGGGEEQNRKMITELDAMGEMVGSILSFARDDAKREPRTLIDLDALVAEVCEDAAEAGDAVTYKGVRGTTALGRPMALRRVVSNLVDNALKYAGGAEVTLSAEPDRVVVAVEDQGPGIPRSQREKVFEPFYRGDNSRNPDTGGVGLGLSVARSIAREHGGDIILAARKGGGLSARLELPA
jgi:signal transduction histidine kinase